MASTNFIKPGLMIIMLVVFLIGDCHTAAIPTNNVNFQSHPNDTVTLSFTSQEINRLMGDTSDHSENPSTQPNSIVNTPKSDSNLQHNVTDIPENMSKSTNQSQELENPSSISSCSAQLKEINVCNSVQEGVNIAALVLGSLPRLQGPQGDLGPVGLRGPRGVPGKYGPKGNVGESGKRGHKGAKGVTGNDGPKGDVGVPGEIGLRGPGGLNGYKGDKGLRGSRGLTGSIGIKGEPGEQASTPMSAFAVHRADSLTAYPSNGPQVITYNKASMNHGNNFYIHTGLFTCDMPGLYYFSYTLKTVTNSYLSVQLKLNGVMQNSMIGGPLPHVISMSQSHILDLVRGDQVWLELAYGANTAKIGGTSAKINTFTGFLLFAK